MTHYVGLNVLIEKEFTEQLRSKRFYLVLGLILLIGLASIYSAASGIRATLDQDSTTQFIFLSLFSSSGGGLPSFATFISFFLPLIGLTLGFDVINGESSRGTLSRLMAQPIYRDSIIVGKFIGGSCILTLMVTILFGGVTGVGILAIGVGPSHEEVARLIIYYLLTIIYVSFWYALSVMLSMLFKQTTASALAGIGLWLFFTIFVSILSGVLANAVFPVENSTDVNQVVHHQQMLLYLSRISPMNIYSESITTILHPDVRSLGIVFYEQMEGAIQGVLPLGESIMLIWPHIVALFGLIMIVFAVTYIRFMRREIRSNE